MSTLCGIVGLFTLPDYPHTKTGSQRWSMNHDQRLLAEARMEADRVTGSVARGGVLQGLKLALMNIKLYLFVSSFLPRLLPLLTTTLTIVRSS